jgi:hypothetical protein
MENGMALKETESCDLGTVTKILVAAAKVTLKKLKW